MEQQEKQSLSKEAALSEKMHIEEAKKPEEKLPEASQNQTMRVSPSSAGERSEEKQSLARILWLLFSSMLFISAFTFGGGFVIVTFMRRRFVDELRWVDEKEMLDLIALAQSAPGPIAVNAAIMVGWKMAGAAGMAAAVLGTVIPPMAILSVISVFYQLFAENRIVAAVLRGMQSGVAAVILDVALSMGITVAKDQSALHMLIMGAAFIASFFFKINVIWIIACAVLAGVILALRNRKGAGNR